MKVESEANSGQYIPLQFLFEYSAQPDDGDEPADSDLDETEEGDLERELKGVKNDVPVKPDNGGSKITYDGVQGRERPAIDYQSTIGTYLNKRQEALTDFSDRVPGKFVNVFPESIMGGVLGFTYLGENFMGLREDLTGRLKKMVDIHESIHTPDEYETRILTDWIMSKERPKYIN